LPAAGISGRRAAGSPALTDQLTTPPTALDLSRFSSAPRDPDPARSDWHWHIARKLLEVEGRLVRGLDLVPNARVLDYGCGDMPYRGLLPEGVVLVGADLPGNPAAAVELRPDGGVVSEDHAFDAVISTQVLEHVPDPGLYLSECFRLLRPGGRLLLSTVGIQIYHPDPADYWRWTCAGLQRATREAGFELESFEGIMGLMATGLQLIQDSIIFRLGRFRSLQRSVCWVMQSLIAGADRLERQSSRDLNAMCFALVARRP